MTLIEVIKDTQSAMDEHEIPKAGRIAFMPKEIVLSNFPDASFVPCQYEGYEKLDQEVGGVQIFVPSTESAETDHD